MSICACTRVKSLQSCPTICDPMDCSLPGSSVHGILQASILEWVALASSRGSSQPRDWTWVYYVYLHRQAGSLPLVPPGNPITHTHTHTHTHLLCPFIFCPRTLRLLPCLAPVNSAAVNLKCIYLFKSRVFFGYMPRSGIAGLYVDLP